MLTVTLIATLTPMLTLLPVMAMVILPRRGESAPIVIRIDRRRYRNAPGTIENEATP